MNHSENHFESRSSVRLGWHTSSAYTTLDIAGVLDGTTYRTVRDAVIKAALDEPPLLVVDVTSLQAPSPSAWSVLTSARWLIGAWPDIPIGLVCSHAVGRRALARNGITRYLPVYGNLAAAVDSLAAQSRPQRRRVRQVWPASASAVDSIREFVSHWMVMWSLDELAPTVGVVATVLVDNVLRHTGSDPDVRLETDGETVTVAVTDHSHAPAGMHEDEMGCCLKELQIVGALSRVWGNTPTQEGKVVWAVMGPENCL